jgi:predicted small metal-binding protein
VARKVADCRRFPSENGCTLTIAGEEEEVMAAAIAHAISAHHHADDTELRSWLRSNLEDEATAGQ